MPRSRSAPTRALRFVQWRPTLVLLGAVVGLGMVVLLLLSRAAIVAWGADFAAYYEAAGRLLGTGSPYQPETVAGPFRPGPVGLYLYSPTVAILFAPLTALAFDPASVVWLVLRAALFAAACAVLPVPRSIRLAVFASGLLSYPVLRDLILGNVSIVVTFLAALGWRYVDRWPSGLALAAAVFIRPHLGLLVAWSLVRRQYTVLVAFAAATAGVVLLSLPVVGIAGWTDYVAVLRNMTGVTGTQRNSDLASAAMTLGVPEPIAVAVLFGGYVLALGAVLISLRRDRDTGFVVTVMATLLLSPLMWEHYLAYLILPAALLATRGPRWAVLLPLLGWLPLPVLPLVVIVAMLAPLLLPPARPVTSPAQA